MVSRKASSIVTGASIISLGMLLSRLLGLVRENLMFHTFGDSNIAGAYNLAFVTPDLFYNLLAGGAMSAAFIPIFTSYLTNGKDKEAHETGSTIATLLLVAMTVCVLICIIFAPQFIGLLQLLQPPDRHLRAEDLRLTVSLMRIMCVMLIFTAQSGHFTGILNSYKHFLTPVMVWLVYNLSIIVGILCCRLPIFGGSVSAPNIHTVAYSVVAGSVLLAAIQYPVALRYGFRLKFAFDLAHEGVRKVLKLFLPVMVSLALSQINLLMLPLVLGTYFGLPAVTDIRAANRLVLLPLGLFAIAISTAAFPKLAELAAHGETVPFRATLAQSMKFILLLSLPSVAILFVLAEPITYLLWGGGKFGQDGVRASAFVLMFFSWGLLALGLVQVVNRAYYAMHDMITPTVIGVSMVVCNFALSIYLAHHASGMRYASVAFATTITTTLSTILLTLLMRRRLGGGGRIMTVMALKTCLATVVMGVVLFGVAHLLAPTFAGAHLGPAFRWPAPDVPYDLDAATIASVHVPRLPLIFQVGGSILCGGLAYVGMLKLLKVKELTAIADRLLRRKASIPTTA
ncbi:MAG TPA: murein biosynthesis integral membrane protein MurJ [Armatimonadota bacterium]